MPGSCGGRSVAREESRRQFFGRGIQGNRVVGATNENHDAYGITPDLQIDMSADPALKILPGHVHSAIRDKYALGDANPLAQLAPLDIDTKLALL